MSAIQRSTSYRPLEALTWLAHFWWRMLCWGSIRHKLMCLSQALKNQGMWDVAFVVKTATLGMPCCGNRSGGWSYWLCSSWSQCGWRALCLVWRTVWIPRKQQPTAWSFCVQTANPMVSAPTARPCTSYSDALCEPYNWLVNGQGKAKYDLVWPFCFSGTKKCMESERWFLSIYSPVSGQVGISI